MEWESLDQTIISWYESLSLPDPEKLKVLLSRDYAEKCFRISEMKHYLPKDVIWLVESYVSRQEQINSEFPFTHPVVKSWIEWYLRGISREHRKKKTYHVDWESATLRDALLLVQDHWPKRDFDLLSRYSFDVTKVSLSLPIGWLRGLIVTVLPHPAAPHRFVYSIGTENANILLLQTMTMSAVLAFVRPLVESPGIYFSLMQKAVHRHLGINEKWKSVQDSIYDQYKPDDSPEGAFLYFNAIDKIRKEFDDTEARKVMDESALSLYLLQ